MLYSESSDDVATMVQNSIMAELLDFERKGANFGDCRSRRFLRTLNMPTT